MRIADLIETLEHGDQAAVVMVAEARGSVPREAGAAMLVTAMGSMGTIGGGTVEHRAIEHARVMLGGRTGGMTGHDRDGLILDFPLGPGLDQCCGGHMRVAFAVFGQADLQQLRTAPDTLELWSGGPVFIDTLTPRQVLVYGSGHVGTALMRALAPLPFAVRWIDARPNTFPAEIPVGVKTVATPLPEAEAKAAPADSLHVVLTHSHALDMEIVSAVLERGAFGYLGLIGSATKKALFLRRLRGRAIPEARLARLTCPIGVPGVRDKRPAVIAASIAVQLLQVSHTAVRVNRETT